MEFLVNTDGTHRTLETVRWSCKPIILSIGHFKGQLKYNWTVSKRLLTSGSKPVWKSRLLLKAQLIFFNEWFENCIILNELTFKEFLHVMLHSVNCSDIQMALQTDHLVDQTFGESNWSPTEQLVKAC